jgi:hypothetical protein
MAKIEIVPVPQEPDEKPKEPERTGFEKVPVYRGFTLIKDLFALATEKRCIICGGYVRWMCSPRRQPTPAGDVDVYPHDEEAFEAMKDALAEIGFSVYHENPMAVTYTNPQGKGKWWQMPRVQLIKPVRHGKIVAYGSMEEILANFDFTVVRIGLLSEEEALADVGYLEDEKKHVIRLRNIHCPVSSTLRCMKYAKKGYWLRPSEAIRLFVDWDERGDDYKTQLFDLFFKSAEGEISEEEVEQLEWLLRID